MSGGESGAVRLKAEDGGAGKTSESVSDEIGCLDLLRSHKCER
jgi:hypothetical protein